MPVSATSTPLQERFAGLVHLHSSAPQVPIIAILDSDDEKAAIQSLDLGAAAYCLKKKCDIDLSGVIRSAVKKERQPAGSIAVDKPRFLQTAEIISVFGAKGGVGTSTVALNLASALAQKDKVILAEFTPAFGTLGQYFGLHDRAPGIASFKEMPSDLIGMEEVKACLWSVSKQPELSIFLGPQTVEDCKEIRPFILCCRASTLLEISGRRRTRRDRH
jgi:Mrp family chromosome partitioning ATPase